MINYEGTKTVGGNTITSQGDHDVYVAKVSTLGNFEWVRTMGTSQEEYGAGVFTDINNEVIGLYHNEYSTISGNGAGHLFRLSEASGALLDIEQVMGLGWSSNQETYAEDFIVLPSGASYLALRLADNFAHIKDTIINVSYSGIVLAKFTP